MGLGLRAGPEDPGPRGPRGIPFRTSGGSNGLAATPLESVVERWEAWSNQRDLRGVLPSTAAACEFICGGVWAEGRHVPREGGTAVRHADLEALRPATRRCPPPPHPRVQPQKAGAHTRQNTVADVNSMAPGRGRV